MTIPTRNETASHAPDCPCAWCRVDRDNAAMPTRAEMCADLARAMFPTAVIEPSLSGSGVDIRIYDRPNETRSWRDFDPFTSADDKDALVAWLAENDARWKEFKQELLSDWASSPEQDVVRFALTAPLETIAEAAWRSIQEEAK